jgi:hypothetical protein
MVTIKKELVSYAEFPEFALSACNGQTVLNHINNGSLSKLYWSDCAVMGLGGSTFTDENEFNGWLGATLRAHVEEPDAGASEFVILDPAKQMVTILTIDNEE